MTINAPDRATVIFIVADDALHFTSGPLQNTVQGTPLCFPLNGDSPFKTAERIMQIHLIAHHGVDIEAIRTCGEGVDYKMTYSPYQGRKAS